MPGWDDILSELGQTPSQHDFVRRKYLKELSDLTGRNVITYNSIKGMDCSKGLDLVLHTPGGFPTAAEAIVKYLRVKFNNDIRVIVPQLAMSAGTMIACSAKTIIMGKQSSLGPINPQNIGFWQLRLQQYPAAFLMAAQDAIELSDLLVVEWLGTCMFDKNIPEDEEIIKKICQNLNEHNKSKNHGRHFDYQFCKDIGLKIEEMENNPPLQDAILSMHHAYMLTLNGTAAVKIIESQNDKAFINHAAPR